MTLRQARKSQIFLQHRDAASALKKARMRRIVGITVLIGSLGAYLGAWRYVGLAQEGEGIFRYEVSVMIGVAAILAAFGASRLLPHYGGPVHKIECRLMELAAAFSISLEDLCNSGLESLAECARCMLVGMASDLLIAQDDLKFITISGVSQFSVHRIKGHLKSQIKKENAEIQRLYSLFLEFDLVPDGGTGPIFEEARRLKQVYEREA